MSEFVAFLQEVFEEFGPVQSKKMFGGYGLFRDGLMFGLVADDTLYLKADEANAAQFESRDLDQFEYGKGDKQVKMSYYLAPEDIFDDRELAAEWAARSYEAALRGKNKSSGKKKPKKRRLTG